MPHTPVIECVRPDPCLVRTVEQDQVDERAAATT